jgi:RNA polymerase sigma-70 factor (ECF subfamily)
MLPELTFQPNAVNGRAGLVAQDEAGRALAVASIAIAHGLIERIWVIRNPGKLTGWN